MTLKNEDKQLTIDDIDFSIFADDRLQTELERAARAYHHEMFNLGYSPLTMGSYLSSVGRFITFLRDGTVTPDKEQ